MTLVTFFLILLRAAVTLSTLRGQIYQFGGILKYLPRFSCAHVLIIAGLELPITSPAGRQVLLDYFPTLFATLTEPVFFKMARFLSLYIPFSELASGVEAASSSLDLTYAARIPQVVVFKAFRSGHWLLASLGISGLASNILTVIMNGHFYTAFLPVHEAISSSQLHQTSID